MKRTCREIVLASVLGAALAACSTTSTGGISNNNGLIEYNTDAAGVSAPEAELLYGANGTSGTGTASGPGTPTTLQSTNNSGTHY